MNELEAMNMLLRLIGSSPVNSLDTPHPDAANAKATLDRIREQAQRTGWWFNIDYDITLQAGSDGRIELPKQYSTVIFRDLNYIKRGKYVYDRVKQTNKINGPVCLQRVTTILPWEEMPEVMCDYVAYFAASQFVRDELEDPNKEANLKESAAQVLLDVRRQDLDESRYNVFNKSRVLQARAGTRPYSRNIRRIFGDYN